MRWLLYGAAVTELAACGAKHSLGDLLQRRQSGRAGTAIAPCLLASASRYLFIVAWKRSLGIGPNTPIGGHQAPTFVTTGPGGAI